MRSIHRPGNDTYGQPVMQPVGSLLAAMGSRDGRMQEAICLALAAPVGIAGWSHVAVKYEDGIPVIYFQLQCYRKRQKK